MVPWHPPCALISLIFSSLDPETNCLFYLRMEAFLLHTFALCSQPRHYSVSNWPFFESFSVQLSRCRCSFRPSLSAVRYSSGTNPENDTEPSTLRINSFRDAVRLLSTHPLRCLTCMTFMLALSLTASTAESLAILADRP